MKKILLALAAVWALALPGCVKDANYTSSPQDVRVNNPVNSPDIQGVAYTEIPLNNVTAFITLQQGWGRTLTISADYATNDGVGMPPTQFTMPGMIADSIQTMAAMWSNQQVTLPLDGTPGPEPGLHPIVFKIEGGGRTIEHAVMLNVLPSVTMTLAGTAYTDVDVQGIVFAHVTIQPGWATTITASAEYVDGVGMKPTQYDLSAQQDILMPLDGVAGSVPGEYPFVLKITRADGRISEFTDTLKVVPAPGFQLVKNADGTVAISSNKYYNSFYGYSLTGRRLPADAAKPYIFDSSSEDFHFSIPYLFGKGRQLVLDHYDLYRIGRFGRDTTLLDPVTSGWSLELLTPLLSSGAATDSIKLKVHGQAATHFDLLVKNLRLLVKEAGQADLVIENGASYRFPLMRFRMFDMLYDHFVGPYVPDFAKNQKLTVGYDTARVASTASGVVRAVLDQVLGETTGKYRPFRYQWGRAEDGHQVWFNDTPNFFSVVTTGNTPSATTSNVGTLFWNLGSAGGSWYSGATTTDTYWSKTGSGGVNNPCPPGYRLPTLNEVGGTSVVDNYFRDYYTLNEVTNSAGSTLTTTAMGPLTNGVVQIGRNSNKGAIQGNAKPSFLWTCTNNGTNAGQANATGPNGNVIGNVTFANQSLTEAKGNGYMVRCIQLLPGD